MLTDEQERVVASEARTLVVNAYAGSGKTSTLVEYARRRPNERLLYLAFNRSIKEEAANKFPPNVRCITTHGLAFPTHGRLYQGKLGNPKASHLARVLEIDVISAGRVLAVIMNYLSSTSKDILDVHAFAVAPKGNAAVTENLVDYARTAWAAMCDVNSQAIPMPHDGYLKLYQLSQPTIKGVNTILFDEAQDANSVTLDIVARQACGKVFVGDSWQAIYSFRGAVNALSHIKADERLHLTTSFRFGDGIATLATALLSDWGGATKPVQGKGKYQSVFDVDRNAPHAVLSRTNAVLFEEAIHLLGLNAPFGFAGGVESYRFDQILDTYHLFARQRGKMRDQFLAAFNSFDEMKQYGEELDDKEVKALVKVVEAHLHETPGLIDEIKDRAVPSLSGREVALATTHKAKGLEWMDVVLTEDFTELKEKPNDKGEMVPPDQEEVNILYVAMTRAMRGIVVPSAVHEWLEMRGTYHLIGNKGRGSSVESPPQEVMDTMSFHLRDIHDRLNTLYDLVRRDAPSRANEIAKYLRSHADRFSKLG